MAYKKLTTQDKKYLDWLRLFLFLDSLLEPETLTIGYQDMGIVSDPVKQGCSHFFIAEYLVPFREFQIGGYDGAALLVTVGEELKQQFCGPSAERYVTQFVDYHQIFAQQLLLEFQQLLRPLHLGQDIYQSRGGVESNLVLGLTGTDPQGDCQMSFSGAGIASQDHIFFVFNVLPPREGEDFGLVKVWILRKMALNTVMHSVPCGSCPVIFGPQRSLNCHR